MFDKNKWFKDRYYRRKDAGKCVKCGVREPREGTFTCVDCSIKVDKRKAALMEKAKANDLCVDCCKAKREDGIVRCTACADKLCRRDIDIRIRSKTHVLEQYGGARCNSCGEADLRCLSLDHVNDDGAAHRRKLGISAGLQFYAWLRKNGYPNDPPLQVLCMNCQFKKRNQVVRIQTTGRPNEQSD